MRPRESIEDALGVVCNAELAVGDVEPDTSIPTTSTMIVVAPDLAANVRYLRAPPRAYRTHSRHPFTEWAHGYTVALNDLPIDNRTPDTTAASSMQVRNVF